MVQISHFALQTLSCLIFFIPPAEVPDRRRHMNLPSAESEQWTCKQGSNKSDAQEFALHPYDHVGDRLADKHRCDDAVSSSATHGSVSTSRASRRQTSDRQTDTPPTSDGKAMDNDGDDSSTRKLSPDSSTRTHISNGRAVPTGHTSSEDRSFCLARFVQDVDPREMARLGKIDSVTRGRSRERCKEGAGRCRGRRSKSKESHYDQTRVVEERKENQEKDGAA